MRILSLFTNLLHFLPTEVSHTIGLYSLKVLYRLGLLKLIVKKPLIKSISSDTNSNNEFLSKFSNNLGVAAGLDKNGDFIDPLASLGVGFIEIGTVTPRAQKGNKKPRLFRDKKNFALFNRLGFNNKGVDYLIKKVKQRKSIIPLGISIGKNSDTP